MRSMPPRAVNALERLAPDQRAAVELVLRGRSYAELAGLLGISEDTVRRRARGGLEALAPDLPPPARAGEIADWLLGQGDAPPLDDPGARRWAETVSAPLREVNGVLVPAIPAAGAPAPAPATPSAVLPSPSPAPDTPSAVLPSPSPAPDTPSAVPRSPSPAPDTPSAVLPSPSPAPDTPSAVPRSPSPAAASPPAEPPAPPSSPGRSSRLGGAILLAVALVAVGVVLAFVLTRGGDDTPTAEAPTATATPVATGTPAAQAGDIVLKGPAGSKTIGLLRLFRANDDTVRFALAAQDVPPNTGKDTYSIWFTKKNGAARRLGVAQSQVGKDGTLTTAGPRNEDVEKFPEWFASYDSVLVTLDASASASKPGKVVLSGNLPHASG
jgi:Sigma-70, region 4